MTAPVSVLAPRIRVTKNKTWTNWHESVSLKVARQVTISNAEPSYPSIQSYSATTEALQQLLAEAADEGLNVRAVGGTWSMSAVAAAAGMLINTQPLNYRFWLADADLAYERQGRGEDLVFAQCGMSVAELNIALRTLGKSLRTSGASNGQTIAGAIGGGTHGSAIDQGSLHDSVVALHIVTSANRHVWIERATDPVASQAFIDSLGAEPIRSDEVFNAALVSFGAFGIVHGVVLEFDQLFWLEQHRMQYDDDAATWAAIEQLDFTALNSPYPGVRPYFFQALFNPYDMKRPYLSLMYRHSSDPGGPKPAHDAKWKAGDGAAELVAKLINLAGGSPPKLGAAVMKAMYPDVNGLCGTWGDMFWDTSTRGRSASSALGIPTSRAREAVDVLYQVNTTFQVPGAFAMRFVRSSRATLAFTRHEPVTCVLEADGASSQRMLDFYEAAWEGLSQAGIPFTFHWGKMHPDKPDLVAMYGQEAVDAWTGARQSLLTTQEELDLFNTPHLKSLGLQL